MAIEKLSPKLEAKREELKKVLPDGALDSIQTVVNNMAKSYKPSTLSLGDVAPSFSLPNSVNEQVSLGDLLKSHKAVVITWYRGGWCPYCNVALHSLIQINDTIEKSGAKLVALSPELPDESMTTKEKLELPFQVLTDSRCEVAEKYGIAFTLDDPALKVHADLGMDFYTKNGNKPGQKNNPKLPLPATFILNQKGEIIFKFADFDYTKRVEPQQIVDVIQSL